jgi:hypothetical protein
MKTWGPSVVLADQGFCRWGWIIGRWNGYWFRRLFNGRRYFPRDWRQLGWVSWWVGHIHRDAATLDAFMIDLRFLFEEHRPSSSCSRQCRRWPAADKPPGERRPSGQAVMRTSTAMLMRAPTGPMKVPLTGSARAGSRVTATRMRFVPPMSPFVGSNSTHPAP